MLLVAGHLAAQPGIIDPTFDLQQNGTVSDLKVAADGQIFIAGTFTSIDGVPRTNVARLSSDGMFDWSFDSRIQMIPAFPLFVGAQSTGKLVVAGAFTNFNSIIRLDGDGFLDFSFASPSRNVGGITAASVDGDDSILVAGAFQSFDGTARRELVRLLPDGGVDLNFDAGTNFGIVALALQPNGQILISSGQLRRLHPNGSRDTSFQPQVAGAVDSIYVQTDNKILIGGSFTFVNSVARTNLARLLPDGAIDPSFDLGVSPNDRVRAIAVQANGKILIGGSFTSVNGAPRRRIARLLFDGALDTAFGSDPDSGPNATITKLAFQSDGQILIAGSFITVDGFARRGIARLHAEEPPASLPVFYLEPTDRAVSAGSFVTLSSLAWSYRTPAYQWRLNDNDLPGATNASLIISSADATNAGAYVVVVTNAFGAVTSAPAIFTVHTAPFVTADPTNVRVAAGYDTTFRVSTLGRFPLSYQWLFEGDPLSGATSPILTLFNVRETNQGAYSVVVTNTSGVVTSALATLTVTPAPPRTPHSVDIDFHPGAFPGGTVSELAIDANGKILTAGISLLRLHADGSRDTNFSVFVPGTGVMQFVALTANEKIIVNRSSGAITRFHSDGSVDSSFATFASSAERIDVLGIQSDGKIVRSLSTRYLYWGDRLDADGGRDTSFNGFSIAAPGGTMGAVHTSHGAITADDHILIGSDLIFRMHPHGSTDTAFSSRLLPSQVSAIAPRHDGKIFVAGSFTNILGVPRRGLALLNVDGSLDPAFDPVTPPLSSIIALVPQSDGKLLIGGSFTTVGPNAINRIARLNPDGSFDSSFTVGSGANATVHSIIRLPGGKLLVAGDFNQFNGYSRRNIVRLNSDAPIQPYITEHPLDVSALAGKDVSFSVLAGGVPDVTYQWRLDGVDIPSETNAVFNLRPAVLQDAGGYRVVISNSFGAATSEVARLDVELPGASPGAVEPTFSAGTGGNSLILAMVAQPDGKIIVGGLFTEVHGVPRKRIARLNADGTLDLSFDPGDAANLAIRALALQPDGKVLIGGAFLSTPAGSRIGRLNADGSVDSTFVGWLGGQPGQPVSALALQRDGRILVGTTDNSQNIQRLHPDGRRDETFTYSLGGTVQSLVALPSGATWAGTSQALYFSPGTNFFYQINGNFRHIIAMGRDSALAGTQYGLWMLGWNGQSPSAGWLDFHADVRFLLRLNCDRVLMWGGTGSFNAPPSLMRLLPLNESPWYRLDPSFAPVTTDANVWAAAVQANQDVVIGGDFMTVNGFPRKGIARIQGESDQPPGILNQSGTNSIIGGHPYSLTLATTNCVSVQWQRSGTNIPGATNLTLDLGTLSIRESGDYRAIVSNGRVAAIHHIETLTVLPEARHPGSLDVDYRPTTGFNGNVYAMAIDSNKNVLVGGDFTLPARLIARFTPQGQFDPSFRALTNFSGVVRGLAIQPDGKIVAAGLLQSSIRVIRLLPDGRTDTSFSLSSSMSGGAQAVAVQPDGKIIRAGFGAVARYHTNGLADTGFNGAVRGYVSSLGLLKDGRMVVGGSFTNLDSPAHVARLQTNGALDLSFDPFRGPNGLVISLAIARDERIYIGGSFTQVDGFRRVGIARLNQDGSLDHSFDPETAVYSIWALAVQPNNKLLVGNSSHPGTGAPRIGIARFNPDGSLDATFDPGVGISGQVFAVATEPAGKIFIGGNFTDCNGYPRDNIARINGDLFLLNPTVNNGQFNLSLFTFNDQTYTLEYKDTPDAPQWNPLPPIIGNGAMQTLTDPASPSPSRIYHVRTQWP